MTQQLEFPSSQAVCNLIASDPHNQASVDSITTTILNFGHGAEISRNDVAPHLEPWVNPACVGAVFSGLVSKGVLVWTKRWDDSDDKKSRNDGKPCKVYRIRIGGVQ